MLGKQKVHARLSSGSDNAVDRTADFDIHATYHANLKAMAGNQASGRW